MLFADMLEDRKSWSIGYKGARLTIDTPREVKLASPHWHAFLVIPNILMKGGSLQVRPVCISMLSNHADLDVWPVIIDGDLCPANLAPLADSNCVGVLIEDQHSDLRRGSHYPKGALEVIGRAEALPIVLQLEDVIARCSPYSAVLICPKPTSSVAQAKFVEGHRPDFFLHGTRTCVVHDDQLKPFTRIVGVCKKRV
jgi:hypothetical protein